MLLEVYLCLKVDAVTYWLDLRHYSRTPVILFFGIRYSYCIYSRLSSSIGKYFGRTSVASLRL